MGRNAFTHCAGVHTHAAAINPTHYESLSPDILGKERHFSLDHMSGITSIKYALELLNITDLSHEQEMELLNSVKSIGQKGKVVELSELEDLIHYIKQNHKNNLIKIK
jgi:2-isopropylmalate synthase